MVVLAIPLSVATVDAPLSVLNMKFRTKGPVNGFAENTKGLSEKLTEPDFTTEIVFALPKFNTVEGAFETSVRFVDVNAPVGPATGRRFIEIVSLLGDPLRTRTAA